jgi:hypothetical protein
MADVQQSREVWTNLPQLCGEDILGYLVHWNAERWQQGQVLTLSTAESGSILSTYFLSCGEPESCRVAVGPFAGLLLDHLPPDSEDN